MFTQAHSVNRWSFLPSFLLLCVSSFIIPNSGFGAEKTVCYVSIGNEQQIAWYDVNLKNGELTNRQTVDLPGDPGSFWIDSKKQYLYVALRSTNEIATLKIDPKSGKLTFLQKIKTIGNPTYIALDQTEKYLVAAYYRDAKATVHAVKPNHTLRKKPVQVIGTDTNPHSILTSPCNQFLYIPNTGADCILQFAFDETTGKATPLSQDRVTTAEGDGPRHFRFHPTEPFVYVVNEKGSSVTAYRIDPESGVLTGFQTLGTIPETFIERNTNADIEITPNGKFVYTSSRGHDSLAAFEINKENGELTTIGIYDTEKTPREFSLDPTGQYLYSAGQRSDRMISYKIEENGVLTPLKTYEVGKLPSWVDVIQLP
ncbi:6-phosphogluconolactonase [Planctomycetales bacterium 10988]|nr:6-phosphogluconolactonase [Planctomycetales bacterium 10988]